MAQGPFASYAEGMRLFLITSLAMVAFAANSILNRLAVGAGHADAESFAILRLLSGALMLALLVWRRGVGFRQPPLALAIGGVSLTLYMLGFSAAYRTLDAGLGALVLFGVVQFTMVGWTVARGGRITLVQTAGGGLALTGLALVLWPGEAVQAPLSGLALMVLAGLGWGAYSLAGRGAANPLGATAGNFWLSLVLTLALVPLMGWQPHMNLQGAALAIVSGAITSGVGYALWYSVLPALAGPLAATIQLSVPVIAIAAGAALLGEVMAPRQILGAVVVLGGIALVLRGGRPKSQ